MMGFKTDYYTIIVLFLMDVAFAVWWVRMRIGLDKRWFVVPAEPFVSRGFYFALPTFTVGFVIVLIGVL
jgi:hypothetical protein